MAWASGHRICDCGDLVAIKFGIVNAFTMGMKDGDDALACLCELR